MKRSDVFPQKFTKAEDLNGREIVATIAYMVTEEVGQEKKEKPVLYFEEGNTKPIVLNATNWGRLEHAYGDSDRWPGQKVQLYSELVTYQGKSMPGVRLRAIRNAPPRPPAAGTPPKPDRGGMDDDIPF
jgi:hypothetical protein